MKNTYVDTFEFEEYMRSLNRSERTISGYAATIHEYYERDCTPAQYIKWLYKKGNSPNTRANKYFALKSWSKYLQQIGKSGLEMNFPSPRKEEFIPKTLTKEEIVRMLDVCDLETEEGMRAFALINFLQETGCRISEALDVRIGTGSEKYSHIAIEPWQTPTKKKKPGDVKENEYTVIFRKTKTKSERKNFISADLAETVLGAYWTIKENESSFLFSNLFNGRQFSRYNAVRVIKIKAAAAGVKKNVYPHIFRDTKVTKLVDAGIHNQVIATTLGFKDVRRIRTYYHASNRILRQALKTPVVNIKEYIKNRKSSLWDEPREETQGGAG